MYLKKYWYLALLLIVPFILYLLYNKFFGATGTGTLGTTSNNNAPPTILSNSDAKLIADRVAEMLEGVSEDEDNILHLLLPLSMNDYALVYEEFGVRKIFNSGFFVSPILYVMGDGHDLNHWLIEFLSNEDINKIKHLIN